MPKNSLTQSRLKQRLHYDPETGLFTRKALPKMLRNSIKTGDIAGWEDSCGYIRIRIDITQYRAHRIAFLYMTGEIPVEVDHINGDGLDNRWSNLRAATHTINQRNRKTNKNNKSGVKGVSFEMCRGKPKWVAQIRANGRQLKLKRFDDWFDAVCARKSAENKYGYLSRD